MSIEEVTVCEAELNPEITEMLIALSAEWEAEKSCYGYRKNAKEDIDGNRIFLAKKDARIIGYLFGHKEKAERSSSVMPDGTPFFEVEELYVTPDWRGKGIGKALFTFAEQVAAKDGAHYLMLSTATKNWQAIFHFYLDELKMEFWSARLFKKIQA